MNKVRVTIENYRMLWKEPDFRWLQEFNWLRVVINFVRGLGLLGIQVLLTTTFLVLHFFLEGLFLDYLKVETDLTWHQMEPLLKLFPGITNMISSIAVAIFMVWLMHYYFHKVMLPEPEVNYVERYSKSGFRFEEKDKKSKESKLQGSKLFRVFIVTMLFMLNLNLGTSSKMVSLEFLVQSCWVLGFLTAFLLILKFIEKMKFKKLAKDFKENIYILTTERDFIRLTNQMESLLILPEKWMPYLKEDLAVFTQSVKRTDIKIEGEPVNDVVSRLKVVYLVPFTTLRIVCSIQLVEFETEVELNEYKKDLEEAYKQAPGKGPRGPEINVLLANLETDNLNCIKADSLSKKK